VCTPAASGSTAIGPGGNGSPAHVIGEYFKLMTGTNLIHVPYRGPVSAVTALGYIRAVDLHALAMTTATRSEALPDIPTLGEFISGFRGKSVGRARCTQGHFVNDHRETQC
jgi:tripartite-type tricarboxylate transporter receptor subunit TctC